MGTKHVKACESLKDSNNLQIRGVADCWKSRAEAAAAIGEAKAFVDYRKLLDDKQIDYVTIATPEHRHASIVLDAFDAGKAVYCEKPLAHTVEDGHAVAKRQKETGLALQVGVQSMSDSCYRTAAEAIAGALLLAALDSKILEFVIAVIIVLSAAALRYGVSLPLRNEASAYAPVGLVCGFLQSCTGMGGPPLVMLFANQRTEKQRTRADLSAVFLMVSLVAAGSQMSCGLVTTDVLMWTAWLVPATLIGTFSGMLFAKRINNDLFRTMTLWLVLLTGAIAIAAAMLG